VEHRGWNKKDTGSNEVNMTPLIDISLVLVVILLLATPLAFQSSIGLRNTRASGKQSEEESRVTRVELDLVSEDSLRVNGRLIARADLGARIAPLLRESADRTVVITCADQVSHGTFVAVIDEAKHRGAAEIAMVGR
jgi:biopolymer transport protein ExbD